jgi:amidase
MSVAQRGAPNGTAAMTHDLPEYRSARDLAGALARGELSSRDLLERFLARIDRLNPALNAVVAFDRENARRAADAADAAQRRGEARGALHGLPLTVKDTYEVPGMPCTAGAPRFRDHLPKAPALAVRRLQEAGAIVFGKTNVPFMASDLQSYNKIYGVTNNPWDRRLTSGGSSGGAAVALAAGFTPLELGSDIGGSIRIPAHFCGVYGHKPTHGIISLRGHIPGPPGVRLEPHLAVAGPMARTADDLDFMLDLVAGDVPSLAPGWKLALPPARHGELKEFRVLLWLDDPQCPIDEHMQAVYRELRRALEQAGASVDVGAPAGFDLDRLYPPYVTQLTASALAGMPGMQRRLMNLVAPVVRKAGEWLDTPAHADRFLEGAGLSHAAWLASADRAARLREKFVAAFEKYDVILAPPALTTAFAHDHSPALGVRKLTVNGVRRHYTDMFMWIAPATLLGLPATSAPVGVTEAGLPVNVQVIGAPYEDKTTIRFAALLEQVIGGFRVPPLAGD